MAKAPAKPVLVKAVKKSPAKPKAKSASVDIEKITEEVLAKLRALDIEHSLQSDIDWCLGSYRSDRNPIGLYDMISRALPVLKSELKKKTKGVSIKLIGDIEAALSSK
jgi:hypothetical protein